MIFPIHKFLAYTEIGQIATFPVMTKYETLCAVTTVIDIIFSSFYGWNMKLYSTSDAEASEADMFLYMRHVIKLLCFNFFVGVMFWSSQLQAEKLYKSMARTHIR